MFEKIGQSNPIHVPRNSDLKKVLIQWHPRKIEKITEVVILENKNGNVDIQFDDGSIAYDVRKEDYTIL
jgi:hypothetical protein